ncbi:MAG: hypothetical protein K2I94_07935 [Muribaculaceae bacterium]|nr:hypothetical protein [Muribaculaceae bacterium]
MKVGFARASRRGESNDKIHQTSKQTNQTFIMKKFIYSLLPLFIVILSGCSKKDKELDFIKVTSGLTYTVEAAGGTVNVNVETNTDYFVSIPDDAKDWISVVESRASRNETISLSVSENGIDARSTIVYINNKNGEKLAKIKIAQKGEDPCFNVKNGSTVEVESKGGTIDLKFETNLEYSVSIPEEAKSWISVVESRAIRQETVTLSISENDGEARTATIRFVDKNEKILTSIPVNQAESPNAIPSDMTKAFPDEKFRNYVLSNFDTNNNGIISEKEAFAVTKIEIQGTKEEIGEVKSLEGIQYFPNLNYLTCYYNKIANIDISNNKALEYLSCAVNQLTTLDVTKNTLLTYLNCGGNSLTTLEVSKNTVLEYLLCYNNDITTLDISKNIALTYLDCEHNQLSTLNVAENRALASLECHHNQLTTLDVTKNIKLSYLDCRYNQLTALDVSKNTYLASLECQHNQLTTLEISKNTGLTLLGCSYNHFTTLDVSGCTSLKELYCAPNSQMIEINISGCTSLKSFQYNATVLTTLKASECINLEELFCTNNQLSILDISGCIALQTLFCQYNRLTTLDISDCTQLISLCCDNNQLISLDVSKNSELTYLHCYKNQLTTLDISNTNLGNSPFYQPFICYMESLRTLYFKTGWNIEGINNPRDEEYINPNTEIKYVD